MLVLCRVCLLVASICVSVLFFWHFLHPPGSSTHLSALTYSSSTGTQGTLPSLTPIWMSRNCRPRFSPRMVTLVPPWRGPVSGNNWRDGGRRKGEEDAECFIFTRLLPKQVHSHTHTFRGHSYTKTHSRIFHIRCLAL